MSQSAYEFVSIDLPPLMALLFAAISCGLLGNFLVLRRLSLMGDAIAHAVLPGLVLAFLLAPLIAGVIGADAAHLARHPLLMMLGALLSGVVTVTLIESIRRFGKVESGAAMGVAFSVMFALGVLMLEQAAARQVDLDAECVLYGQLETIFWFPPDTLSGLLSTETLKLLPRQVTTLAFMCLVVFAFVGLLYKELRIASFDAGLATTLGFSATILHFALMILIAAAAVASFEAVGSILVIALLICPAATARLLTDRYRMQLALSVVIAIVGCVAGYVAGAHGPIWLGFDNSVNAAGMVTVTLGVLLTLAIFFAPAHGVVARRWRHLRLAVSVTREDLLGLLYRLEEAHAAAGIDESRDAPAHAAALTLKQIQAALGSRIEARLACRRARSRGEIERTGDALRLTDIGRAKARSLIRSHRLWESYLVNVLGLRPDHVHDTATRLEHITDPESRRRLSPPIETTHDPHDRPIPETD